MGAGEDVESEVAAAFGPLVVLLGQDCANQPDDRAAVGEDANDVGAAAARWVEAFVGVVGLDLLGERGEREDVGTPSSRWLATAGSLSVWASTTRSNWSCTDSASGWS